MIKKQIMLGGLCLVLFAIMAVGSGSSSGKKETVKIEGESAAEKASEVDEGKEEKTETSSKEEDEIQYEITDTNFNYYTNSIGKVEYYGYVEITNKGDCNLYLANAVFDLEDNDGHLLQSDDYVSNAPSVIKPGEKGYFYNGIGSSLIDDGVSTDNGINLVPQITIKKATGEPTRYEVTDLDMREDNYGNPKVTGRIVNNTDEDESYLYINVIFYDSNHKVLAITGTSVTDLSAGGKTSFECSSMFADDTVTIDKIADYEVIAEESYMQF
ncbi:MAG: FxLYD domain-containing protein [Lachnospiraceae bacterium]|nr:FxLYD domain-containing protein [Lachnospiraceae bacterium]